MNKKIDIFDGLILPTDAEIRQETSNAKNSRTNTGKTKTKTHIENHKIALAKNGGNKGINNPFSGKTHSEETKKKLSLYRKGRPAHNKGKTASEEARVKMRGKKSEDTKEKMRIGRANRPIVICPHCSVSGKGPNMVRYHFNNCKLNPIKA